MPKENRVINDKFKKLRKMKGTQNFVGKENDVSGTMIRYIENGYATPSGKLMLRLSGYFGVPVEELFATEKEK